MAAHAPDAAPALVVPAIVELVFLDADNRSVEFETFIHGINNVSESNNPFSVANTHLAYLFDEKHPCVACGTRMFIRPCYGSFVEKIMELWFPPAVVGPAFQEQPVPVVVSGTSGIGKTSLRNILCKGIMERISGELGDESVAGARSSIIFQNGGANVYYHAQFERTANPTITVRCTLEVSVTDSFVEDLPHRVYYLVDAPQGDTSKASSIERLAKDKAVYFTSPGQSLAKRLRYLRNTVQAVTLYMPVWELGELQDARAALGLNITVATIRERYNQLGGVARDVLESSPGVYARHIDHYVPEAISALDISLSVDLMSNIVNRGTEISHIAVHIEVGRKPDGSHDYETRRYIWASKWLVVKIAQHVAVTLRRDIEAEKSIFQNTLNATIYESYAIHLLMTERLSTLRIHTMKDTTVMRRLRRAAGVPAGPRFLQLFDQRRAQGPAIRVRFVRDNEMDGALTNAVDGDMIIPTSFRYPAIHCVLAFLSAHGSAHSTVLLYLLVQVTMARELHITGPVADQRLQDMITACGGVDRCALAFFVPPRAYDRLDRQNTPGTKITQLRMTISPTIAY